MKDAPGQQYVVFQYKLDASQKDVDNILKKVHAKSDYTYKNSVGILANDQTSAREISKQLYKNGLVTAVDIEPACYPD